MKKLILFFVLLTVLMSAGVFAQGDNATYAAVANYSGDYSQVSVVVLNTTILNSTRFGSANSTSNTEVFVRVALNLTTNGSYIDENLTLTNLNLTLGDLYAVNDVTKIRLLNSSYGFMMNANGTISDANAPGYLQAYFYAPNITGAGVGDLWIDGGVVGTGEGWYLTNKTWMTMFLEYRLRPLDTNKTVNQIKGTQFYIDNVSYGGYSDMSPTVIYLDTPVNWIAGYSSLKQVDYSTVTVTNYSFDPNLVWIYYGNTLQGVNIIQNNYAYLSVYYQAVGPTSSSPAGTGTTPQSTTTLTNTNNIIIWVYAVTGIIISAVIAVGIYFWRKWY